MVEAGFDVSVRGGASRRQCAPGTEALLSGAEAHDWYSFTTPRCLVTPGQINQLIDACQHDAVSGLLAHKPPDTEKRRHVETCRAESPPPLDRRSDKWLAQNAADVLHGPLMLAPALAGASVDEPPSKCWAHPRLVLAAQNSTGDVPGRFALAEATLP
jgi:hypothetical protein